MGERVNRMTSHTKNEDGWYECKTCGYKNKWHSKLKIHLESETHFNNTIYKQLGYGKKKEIQIRNKIPCTYKCYHCLQTFNGYGKKLVSKSGNEERACKECYSKIEKPQIIQINKEQFINDF